MGGAPSLVLPGLWLGGQDVLHNPSFFAQHNINYVLSLGPSTPSDKIKFVARHHVNLPDMPSSDLGQHFSTVVNFIANCRHAEQGIIYVHCAAGISRSTTCVCAYLMTHLDLTFPEALAFVTTRRRAACPNDGFTRQLRAFEKSELRKTLAQGLALQCPHYETLRARDLTIVQAALAGTRVSLHSTSRSGEAVVQKAQQNAIDAVREIAAKRPEASSPQHHAGAMGELGNGTPSMPAAAAAMRNGLASPGNAARGRCNAGVAPGPAAAPALRIGTGESEGDVGLAWLIQSASPPAAPSGRAPQSARSPGPGASARPRLAMPASGRRAQSQPMAVRTGQPGQVHQALYHGHAAAAIPCFPASPPGRWSPPRMIDCCGGAEQLPGGPILYRL